MGCATPTVIPLSGNTVAATRPSGVSVRNVDVATIVTPNFPAALAVTRYVVAGASDARDCQRLAVVLNAPFTATPSGPCRETEVSRPEAALTSTGRVGAASTVPAGGKIVTDFVSVARSVSTCCAAARTAACACSRACSCARSRAAFERATVIATPTPAQSTIASTTMITPPDPRDHKVR